MTVMRPGWFARPSAPPLIKKSLLDMAVVKFKSVAPADLRVIDDILKLLRMKIFRVTLPDVAPEAESTTVKVLAPVLVTT